jgi:methylglutaconyl-CoA hydratase
MTFEFLEVQRDGPVERVRLNRPAVRNAFNDRVIAELRAWADATAGAAATVHIVVLSGAGKVFSAGADLDWMARGAELDQQGILAEARALHEMLEAIEHLPQGVIARVQGAAIAGGVGLASVCDAVVAADDAVFGFSEVKLGIIPAVISPFVIRKIGVSAARELIVTGRRFSAGRARELGLVHHVVPATQLDEAIDSYVSELRTSNPAAVAAAKALVRDVAAASASGAVDIFTITGGALTRRRMAPDAKAAIRAFLDKRQAPTGKE